MNTDWRGLFECLNRLTTGEMIVLKSNLKMRGKVVGSLNDDIYEVIWEGANSVTTCQRKDVLRETSLL